VTTTYKSLLQEIVPRPISSDAQYKKALAKIEQLMRKSKKTRAEDDMIALLGMLIEQYEISQGFANPAPSPRARLAGLIEARDLTQTKLAKESGVPRTTLGEILAGKRNVSKTNAQRLAKYFRVPVDDFVD